VFYSFSNRSHNAYMLVGADSYLGSFLFRYTHRLSIELRPGNRAGQLRAISSLPMKKNSGIQVGSPVDSIWDVTKWALLGLFGNIPGGIHLGSHLDSIWVRGIFHRDWEPKCFSRILQLTREPHEVIVAKSNETYMSL
jgi:hypothetical protein